MESNLSVKEVEALQNMLSDIINSKSKQSPEYISNTESFQWIDKYIEELKMLLMSQFRTAKL